MSRAEKVRGEACPQGQVSCRVHGVSADQVSTRDERIAEESAIALVYNDEPHAVMMASPLDLDDFALGFSLSERIIDEPAELLDRRIQPLARGVQVSLRIPESRWQRLRERSRSLDGRSGCGICGTREIEQVLAPPRRVPAGVRITPHAIGQALQALGQNQPLNAATGAVHAAAWARLDGSLTALREDVGRHNALDKLIGALARGPAPAEPGFLLLTSRASYEMVSKAANAGMSIMVAISAPTSLAVEFADECGMTLIGFARDARFTIYTRPGRIGLADPGRAERR